MPFRSGLLVKFAGVMVALALIPAALLAFQLINISRRGIEAAVLELHTKIAENQAQFIDEYLRTNHQKVAFALASIQKNLEWAEKQELLQSLIETHPDIAAISMLDGQGAEVVKVYNPDLSDEPALQSRNLGPIFRRFKAQKRVTTAVVGGTAPAVVSYYPLKGEVSARVVLSLRSLGERFRGERFGGTGFTVLVGEEGQPLLYPPERLDDKARASFPSWSIVRSALQAQSVGSSDFEAVGQAFVGAYAPLSSAIGGAVVTLQSREDAYSAATQMKRTAFGAVFAVVLLGMLAAIWQARSLVRPLLSLSRAAEAVSRGDFQAKVAIETRDELQELAETFNKMTAQLHNYSLLQVDRLIAEQRKTEAILFSINDGIVMTDTEGRIQLANRRALELLGLNPLLAIEGKPLGEALPEDSRLRQPILDFAASPKPDAVKDVDASSEKTRKYVRVSAHPVRRPKSGTSVGVVVSVRDVTLERELDKMKEDFLHYITHDLRNPLGSAIGFLDLLLKGTPGVLNSEQHAIVSSVKRANMRLLSMVNNILDIAKMESGRIRLQLKPASITGVAGRSISILESMAKAKDIAVNLEAAEEFSIEADADLIERVFTNLLGNAIKYTPQGGSITVSIADDGPNLRCCVADSGPGIPPEYIGKLFQKFEQVQGQRKGGTGLGLAITKFFVEAHLGQVWIESEVGKGSRFLFTIPKTLAADAEGVVRIKETA